MRIQRRWAIIFGGLASSQTLNAQNRQIEIGLDGGLNYSVDVELLTLAVPFQPVRAAFPLEHRLATSMGALGAPRLCSTTDGVIGATVGLSFFTR